jgi:selenocysteine lyase/cysteine desulfurase
VDKVKDNPKIIINTPMGDDQSCAIANVRIEGLSPAELAKKLYDDYRIFTVAIDMDAVKGVRVTPHLYTRIEDVEKFAIALNDIAKKNAGG